MEQPPEQDYHIRDQEHFDQASDLIKSGAFNENKEVLDKLMVGMTSFHGAKMHSQQFEDMIDMTPVEEFDNGMKYTDSKGNPFTQDNANEQPGGAIMINNAANNGIDIRTGAPVSVRFKMGLMERAPEASLKVLQQHAVDQYKAVTGREPPEDKLMAFKDPYAERLSYMRTFKDAEGNVRLKPTWVNSVRPEIGDIAGGGVAAATIAPEIALGAVGTAVGAKGGPVGMIVGGGFGSALGAAGGDYIRREVARAFGVDDEIADLIDSDIMFTDAMWAGGMDMTVPLASDLVRRGQNYYRLLDPRDKAGIAALKKEIADEAEAIRELGEATGLEFKTRAAQATGDVELLVADATNSRRLLGHRSKNNAEDDLRNRINSGEAIRRINSATMEGWEPVRTVNETAELTQELIQEKSRKLGRDVTQSERSMDSHMKAVDSLDDGSNFQGVRNNLLQTAHQAKQHERVKWDKFRAAYEIDEKGNAGILLHNPQDSPLNVYMANLSEESQKRFSIKDKEATKSFLEDYTPDAMELENVVKGLGSDRLDPGQLHRTLSLLKKDQRRLADDNNTLGWHKGEVSGMIRAIEDTIASGNFVRQKTGRIVPKIGDDLRNSFKEANESTFQRVSLQEQVAVQDVTRTKNGDFILGGGGIRELVFKPNVIEPLLDVTKAVERNPATMRALGNELEAKYRRDVYDKGKWNMAKHKDWLSKYRDHVEVIYGEGSSDYIKNAATFGKRNQELNKRYLRHRSAMEVAYGRKLADEELNTSNVARDMLSGHITTDQMKRAKRDLPTDVWRDIQHHGLESLNDVVMKKAGQEANSAALKKVLTNSGDKISVLYGPKHVKNLTLLSDVMFKQEKSKMAKGSRQEHLPLVMQVSRMLYGGLDPIQRKITGVNKFLIARQNANLDRALADPDFLAGMIKVAPMKPWNLARVRFLMSVPRELLTTEDAEARAEVLKAPTIANPQGA